MTSRKYRRNKEILTSRNSKFFRRVSLETFFKKSPEFFILLLLFLAVIFLFDVLIALHKYRLIDILALKGSKFA